MALSTNRIHQGAETDYAWEREAVDYVLQGLPDVDPYQAWPLQELLDPSTGRLYEIDLLFLGRHALYLIEIKSHPGSFHGDFQDWTVIHEGKSKQMENPLVLTHRKAKVLAGLLKRELPPHQKPYVEPLIFLSNEQAVVQLSDAGRSHVTDRNTIRRALSHGQYPGAHPNHSNRVINKPTMKAVTRALHKLGLRPSEASRYVGQYKITNLINEGPGFQEHRGVHRSIQNKTARIRSYLVPKATTVDRRAQLERAAEREARILTQLGDHPNVLRCFEYIDQAPLGPALLFDPFEHAIPLGPFLHHRSELSFDDRLAILQQIAEALDFCHRKQVLHRNLSPDSVLVRKRDGQPPEVKLHGFHLAAQEEGSLGTQHLDAFMESSALIYQAPEVLDDPTKAVPESDVFSLGVVAAFVLTGQPPAPNLAEREVRLRADQCLHITGARDDILPAVENAIAEATHLYFANRLDRPTDWFMELLEAATAPEADIEPPPEVDPAEAIPGALLPGDLRVERILGTGSTSRVFKVSKEGKSYALKVPHDEAGADRLRAEHSALDGLKHHHLVRTHGMRRVGTRDCLLLEFAGDRTLADEIRAEGSITHDYARRYGDDLLSALQHLEEHSVQHRDIKTANIGFTGDAKKKRHLVLFDLSLAAADAKQLTIGTPAYRDPMLRVRGRWDDAADRWSVALVLYEMLTGHLPESATEHDPPESPVRLEPERFDAAIRDRIHAFFQRALASDANQRFSAAEEMKSAWLALFADSAFQHPRTVTEEGPVPPPDADAATFGATATTITTTSDALATATADTSVEVLPLSNRAKNALDRAGVVTVAELLALPQNHLSAVRGVGRKVAHEIQEVAATLRSRLSERDAPTAPQDRFAPAYRGPRLQVRPGPELGLTVERYQTLHDAGITTTVDLAASAASRIERLLGQAEAKRLRKALLTEDRASAHGDQPLTLDQWTQELFAPAQKRKSKRERQIRALLGLDALPGAPADPLEWLDVPTVAEAFNVTRQAVYANLQVLRERWSECPSLPALIDASQDLLEQHGGLASLTDFARAFIEAHSQVPVASGDDMRQSIALLRLVTELRGARGAASSIVAGRVGERVWFATDAVTLDAARQLGRTADALAGKEPLPSSETVRATLARTVEDTPLAHLPPERLVSLAAQLGRQAALSARLELYPRGMAASRAVSLSATSLQAGDLEPDQVRERVAARYRAAEPLPDRPELDGLLEPHGLTFDDQLGVYRRVGAGPAATSSTVFWPTRLTSAQPHQIPRQSPGASEARQFHESLRVSVERGRFRVLQVHQHQAELAALALAEDLGVPPTSLDQLFAEHIAAKREELEVEQEAILSADREGPLGPHWPLLRKLVRAAASDLVESLLGEREAPQLLVHPGALARYDLAVELQTLVDRAESEDGAAVLLLLPCTDDGAAPSINHQLPVPAPLPGQRLRVPLSWIRNEHRAAAATAPADSDLGPQP